MERRQATSPETTPIPRRSLHPWAKPPFLRGYTFEPAQACAARDAGRLLDLRLNESCAFECRCCYAPSAGAKKSEVPYERLTSMVREASRLGARSAVVVGGGEPKLLPRLRDLVAYISSLDMVPVVFSNCLEMSRDLAEFLYRHDASVMTKLDSLSREARDSMTGRPGSFFRMQKGIQNLFDAGFGAPEDPRELRLGASFVSCRYNLREIEEVWRFCRDRNIFPNIEVLTPISRARQELGEALLSREEIKAYRLRLLEIDRLEYGYDWLLDTPLTASGCSQHLFSLHVTIAGNVRP